jgi:hypothetical protein
VISGYQQYYAHHHSSFHHYGVENNIDPSLLTNNGLWEAKRETLQNCGNDAEYGIAILHAWMIESLGGKQSDAACVFWLTIIKEYKEDMNPACFLLESVFVKKMEVLWIDVGLPGLVYKKVVEEGLFALFGLGKDFLHNFHLNTTQYKQESGEMDKGEIEQNVVVTSDVSDALKEKPRLSYSLAKDCVH